MSAAIRFGAMCVLGALLCPLFVNAEGDLRPATLHVGMIHTLFRGMGDKTAQAQGGLLSDMISIQAGMPCDVSIANDPTKLAEKLQDGQLQLAIMHGIEFAWVKDRYPELQPLVLACNKAIKLRAYVVVRDDSPYKSLADLKGKPLAMPKRNLNHIFLYVNKLLTDAKEDPTTYFQPAPILDSTEAALDAVYDGTNQAVATIIDGVAFDNYKERKPGRAAKLRTILESADFPTAAIVYRPNGTSPDIVKKLQTSLQTAHERPFSRQMLTLWKLSNFAPVPAYYCELCDEARKEYPQPVVPASFIIEPPKGNVGMK